MSHIPPIVSPFNHRFAIVLGSGVVRSIAALGMVEVLQREGLVPSSRASTAGGPSRRCCVPAWAALTLASRCAMTGW